MLSLKHELNRGFTIVEVMIVLAIAGVIMAIVFLAVPQLQRNSRDSQRQSLVEVIHSEMETYAANNTGKYPISHQNPDICSGTLKAGDFSDFYCTYIYNGSVHFKDDLDPSSKTSIFLNANNTTSPSRYVPVQCTTGQVAPGAKCTAQLLAPGQVQIIVHAKCDGSQPISLDGQFDDAVTTIVKTRSYALVMGLERVGTYFCVDNS